ncbi:MULTISPECIES: hypothetical protein [Streptomyces]|uniref:Uncharacterized protein n=1 Tax=Streptomyces liliiviolaceus TaxID=2823109 RepID=A0A940XVL3_9ACTN|nr:hypothetical protein [Streptomyces liliiviolaceus]MBQ0851522.1 hypothetical protein [Streptomyces liliiviolaceus]
MPTGTRATRTCTERLTELPVPGTRTVPSRRMPAYVCALHLIVSPMGRDHPPGVSPPRREGATLTVAPLRTARAAVRPRRCPTARGGAEEERP